MPALLTLALAASPSLAAYLEEHLADCPECRERLDFIRATRLVLKVASMSEKVTVQENSSSALSTDSSSNASALVLRGADLDALSDDPDLSSFLSGQ